jgi:hypothetical protein
MPLLLLLLLPLLLLLLLLCLPCRPHGLLIFSLVCAGQVSNCVLQEALAGALPLHCPPNESSHTMTLCALLQLLCICNYERCKAARCCWAHRKLLLLLLCCHDMCGVTRAVWQALLVLLPVATLDDNQPGT